MHKFLLLLVFSTTTTSRHGISRLYEVSMLGKALDNCLSSASFRSNQLSLSKIRCLVFLADVRLLKRGGGKGVVLLSWSGCYHLNLSMLHGC
ncbi:hypothetical protein BDZ45DRAFT_233121 [Acephala macrosclerotiorum]|nr:hypothetical protein BDZ45DRAFT_233121 [Acephala macrosclerotiorum]